MKFIGAQQLRVWLFASTAALLISSTPCASAQAVFGQIVGTVTDPTGAAIPNATVTVTDVAKGTSVTLKSNGAGEFTADHLIPDTYKVKVAFPGFKAFEQTDVHLFADESPKVNAVLTIGASDQTVEVDASDVPQLKTDKVDVSTTFNAQEIEELPIPDHNFANLQLLLPGAVQLGWAHAADENPQGSKQIQIDGQAFGGVNYTLDGTDNQDAILGIIVINPNSDSMSETKLATQNFDAEFGKAVASVETVQTKSGSNTFHGTLFDNRESSANLARDPFVQSGGAAIPPGLKNQFGGSIGGRIWKDKLFFFADYQGVRQKVGVSDLQTIPSANLISTCLGNSVGASGIAGCDFSEYVTAGAVLQASQNLTHNPFAIYQPGTSTPYVGNVIPKASLSPTALTLFKLLAPYKPNAFGGTVPGLTNNYQGSGTGLFNSNQWDVRIDETVSDKIHAFGRFSRFTDILSGTTMFGAAGGDGFGIGGYGGSSKGANDSLALGTDIAITSKLVTDVRLGYFRYNIIDVKYDETNTNLPIQGENISGTGANSGLTVGVDYGAPDFNVADLNVLSAGSGPNNSQGDGAQYGAGLNVDHCNCPLTEREDQFQIVNNWTKTLGNHAVKFGVDLRYARNLRIPSDNDRTGINQFGTGPTSNGTSGGLGFATLALGDVTGFNRYASLATNAKEFQKRDFFYVQDTWRATPKLTLNLGMRYELYFPEDVNGKDAGALMNLQTGYINVAGEGPIGTNMGVKIAKNTYNPRLGVAYQLNNKTVIRAGYGRSFDLGVFGSEFGHVVTQNLPVLVNQSISAPSGNTSYAFQLDNPASTMNAQVPGQAVTGLSNYVPVAANANGQIVNPGASVNTKARPFVERLPTLDAWNITVQRSITPTISLTASYVGNKGTHTLSDGDNNNTNPNESGITLPASLSSIYSGSSQIALHYDNLAADQAAITTFCKTPAACNNGVPLSGPYAGATNNGTLLQRYVGGSLPACGGPCGWTQGISYYGDDQDSHYNSLQLVGSKSFTHGLSINANYAYAHGRDNSSGYATWNKQAVIGNDGSVRRNSFTAYGLYKLPFGKGQPLLGNVNGFVNQLVSGFQISPTFFWQSGLPFTLSFGECGNDLPGSAPCYVNGSASSLPKGISGYAGGSGANAPTFYKAQTLGGAFTDPGLDTIGNGGRNNAFGPHFFNSDMSLMKNFTIREKYTAQLRMDAFNAFNHINFGNPGGNIEQNGSITSGPGPSGTTNPRQLQFTARIQF